MLGGFLKQMNDGMKYNRRLLSKKKSLKEIYQQEIQKEPSGYNAVDVRERVKCHLTRQKRQAVRSKVYSMTLLLLIGTGFYFVLKSYNIPLKPHAIKKPLHFKTVVYDKANGEQLKVDYFIDGPKAAETRYKHGYRHQNSESYYDTGEQFRSALFYYDTLIVDIYFYKSGDTIQTFPSIADDRIHSVELLKNDSTKVNLKYLDGKVIYGSYSESKIVSN